MIIIDVMGMICKIFMLIMKYRYWYWFLRSIL